MEKEGENTKRFAKISAQIVLFQTNSLSSRFEWLKFNDKNFKFGVSSGSIC